ncbi:hypothetical protein [Flavobacterium gelatinilyticum]|uniref:hypothetical protein n=1 Tax=Flavobacterium gelatinilyticum TaxID=3003260 RepID=UPI00247FE40D|nr:hypothetical protein [Flavobacterium gelatinilyticum]
MEITFTNLHGIPLTEQQVSSAYSFKKTFKENNKLRKVEYYDDKILKDTFYYIDKGFSHEELLVQNSNLLKITEIEDIDFNYTRHYSFLYRDSILKEKGIEIINFKDMLIMTQDLDMETNLPLYGKTYKYYDDEVNGYQFEFMYYSSGELASIFVINDTIKFYEQYRPSELGLVPNFEWWNQYSSYYLNAEPAVPDGIIIV